MLPSGGPLRLLELGFEGQSNPLAERTRGSDWDKSTNDTPMPRDPSRLARLPHGPVSETLADKVNACLKTSKRSAARVPRR